MDFQKIWDKAWQAGVDAANAAVPTPMVVTSHSNPLDDGSPVENSWYVPEGVCGFAWVIVKPGNSKFANWLKKHKLARPDHYYGGVNIWISDYGQSYTRKEAHAYAMAKVLSEETGMEKIWAGSRLD